MQRRNIQEDPQCRSQVSPIFVRRGEGFHHEIADKEALEQDESGGCAESSLDQKIFPKLMIYQVFLVIYTILSYALDIFLQLWSPRLVFFFLFVFINYRLICLEGVLDGFVSLC